jgi:hypothetical protein
MILTPIVYVPGISGLGNCLFQLASAMHYVYRFGYTVVMVRSEPLLWGTSHKHGRSAFLRCPQTGQPLSYEQSIFKGLVFVDRIETKTTLVSNTYTSTRVIPWQDENLEIAGYSQNIDLFKEYLPVMRQHYVFIDAEQNAFLDKYIADRYGDLSEATCVGIRLGRDFAHMKSITPESYQRALKTLGVSDKVFILADVDDLGPYNDLGLKDGCSQMVREPDIIQFYLGLKCRNHILSESTFHLWIAYLTEPTDQTRIVYFEPTDISTRKLYLPGWIPLKC